MEHSRDRQRTPKTDRHRKEDDDEETRARDRATGAADLHSQRVSEEHIGPRNPLQPQRVRRDDGDHAHLRRGAGGVRPRRPGQPSAHRRTAAPGTAGGAAGRRDRHLRRHAAPAQHRQGRNQLHDGLGLRVPGLVHPGHGTAVPPAHRGLGRQRRRHDLHAAPARGHEVERRHPVHRRRPDVLLRGRGAEHRPLSQPLFPHAGRWGARRTREDRRLHVPDDVPQAVRGVHREPGPVAAQQLSAQALPAAVPPPPTPRWPRSKRP